MKTTNNQQHTHRRTIQKYLFAYSSVILALSFFMLPHVSAYDIAVSPIPTLLPDDGVIPKLFRIENLDHQSGMVYSIAVNLTYNITTMINDTDTLVVNGTSHHVINKFTTNTIGVSTNGTWVFACASIAVNVSDPDLTNNQGCWNITGEQADQDPPQEPEEPEEPPEEIEEPEEPEIPEEPAEPEEPIIDCNNMTITGVPALTTTGQQFSYTFTPWLTGDEVAYWIEDLWGHTVKSEVVTTSKAAKKYTPKQEYGARILIVKAQRTRENCPTSNAEALVIVKGAEQEEEEETYEDSVVILSAPSQSYFGESIVVRVRMESEKNRKNELSLTLTRGKETLSKMSVQTTKKGEHEYEITLQLPKDEYCYYEEGEYELLVRGRGDTMTEQLLLNHKECQVESVITQNPITSMYTRQQLASEELILRGTVKTPLTAQLYELIGTYSLEGTYAITTGGKAGNTTYALLYAHDDNQEYWSGVATTISLRLPAGHEQETTPPTTHPEHVSDKYSSPTNHSSSTDNLVTGLFSINPTRYDAEEETMLLEKGSGLFTTTTYLAFAPILLGGVALIASLKKKGKRAIAERFKNNQ